jgi:hypothetical protein
VPRPPSDTVQIAIRIPRKWLSAADEVAARLSPPGVTMSRTDAFRAAIAAGFEALADDDPPKKNTRKR